MHCSVCLFLHQSPTHPIYLTTRSSVSLYLCVHPFPGRYLFLFLSIYLTFSFLHIYLSIVFTFFVCLSVFLTFYLRRILLVSTNLSLYFCIYLYIQLFFFLSLYLFLYLSTYSALHVSLSLYIYTHIYAPVYLRLFAFMSFILPLYSSFSLCAFLSPPICASDRLWFCRCFSNFPPNLGTFPSCNQLNQFFLFLFFSVSSRILLGIRSNIFFSSSCSSDLKFSTFYGDVRI